MTEQHLNPAPLPNFFRCPICGEKITVEESVFCTDNGCSLSCSCGISFAPGIVSADELAVLWNKGLIRDVECRSSRHEKPGFPKIPFIFFWLTGFIFSFATYLGDSSNFAQSLNVFGFFTLLFTIVSALYWANLMSISEEHEKVGKSEATAQSVTEGMNND